jgi:hypothetical protein
MTLLKIKAIIYRYTGIYLAETEENVYIQSKEFWKEWSERMAHPENDMRPRDIQGLMIGMWQARYGFVRHMSRLYFRSYKYRRFWNFLAWFEVFFTSLKWDLKRLFRRNK